MKIISIIGTRPQYIKIKPFYDFCIQNDIDHKIVDTLQHYSPNVSEDIIRDLDLQIDFFLDIKKDSEIIFMSDAFLKIEAILKQEKPQCVLVYGDTNSTFCASLVAYKLKIPVAHVEAGLRCGDKKVPEEINRIFSDTISDLKFCPSREAMENIENGIYSGDLEYEQLNNMNPSIEYGDFGVMTIHRQSNVNPHRMSEILSFCQKIPYQIHFHVHHRTAPILKNLEIPQNILLKESCNYTTMVGKLSSCKFIITDSGGIQKTAPFFGKKALIIRDKIEWKETEKFGYVKKCTFEEKNLEWLLTNDVKCDKLFYMDKVSSPSEIIINSVERWLR